MKIHGKNIVPFHAQNHQWFSANGDFLQDESQRPLQKSLFFRKQRQGVAGEGGYRGKRWAPELIFPGIEGQVK